MHTGGFELGPLDLTDWPLLRAVTYLPLMAGPAEFSKLLVQTKTNKQNKPIKTFGGKIAGD